MKRVQSLSSYLWAAVMVAGLAGVLGCPRPQPQPAPPNPIVDPDPPAPTPEPPAPPGIPAGVVVIEDPSAAGQARGLFLADKKVSAFFKNTGLSHAIYSTAAVGPDGQVPPRARPFIETAKSRGQLPYLFVLDATGATLKEQPLDLSNPDAFVALIAPPHKRSLGCELAPPRLQWTEFGSPAAPRTKLIPRAEWKAVSLEAYLPPVYDQDGRGQCNASGTCSAMETAERISGETSEKLSAGDLYSLINGGRDRGSLLEDGLEAATKVGVATTKTVPYVWDGRQWQTEAVKAERKRNRVVEAFLCPTVEHVASAVQQGFPCTIGIMWYDNFTTNRDGVLPYQGQGGAGGHAFLCYGVEPDPKIPGKWLLLCRNSWGPGWGLGGDFKLPENHLDNRIGGYWAIGSVVRTSSPATEPSELAKPTARRGPTPSEVLTESLKP